jgi:hypothetical protein
MPGQKLISTAGPKAAKATPVRGELEEVSGG